MRLNGKYEVYCRNGTLTIAIESLNAELTIPEDEKLDDISIYSDMSSIEASGSIQTKDINLLGSTSSVEITDFEFIGDLTIEVNISSLEINLDYLGNSESTIYVKGKMSSIDVGLEIPKDFDVDIIYKRQRMSSIDIDGELKVDNLKGKINLSIDVSMSSVSIEILR